MRISHRDLEVARANPSSFKNTINSTPGYPGGPSQYRDWQYSTRQYHNRNESFAYNYLEEAFKKHYKENSRNQKKLAEYQDKLKKYIDDFLELGNNALSWGNKLEMDLRHSNVLVGEIAREDMKTSGSFEIFVFQKEDSDWENELRFPVIQAHYADTVFGVPYSEVAVGVYSFSLDQHTSTVFTDSQVESAIQEVQSISRTIDLS